MEFALNRHALVADDSYPTRTGRSLFILIAYIALGGIFGTLARYLVQGVDIWLNNPRRPLEASGTSGMKAAAKGALNLAILDGW